MHLNFYPMTVTKVKEQNLTFLCTMIIICKKNIIITYTTQKLITYCKLLYHPIEGSWKFQGGEGKVGTRVQGVKPKKPSVNMTRIYVVLFLFLVKWFLQQQKKATALSFILSIVRWWDKCDWITQFTWEHMYLLQVPIWPCMTC